MTTQNKGAARPKKEAIFVQVKGPDNKPVFYDSTSHLGRIMPYQDPMATCALRVFDHAVVFSLLKLTKNSKAKVASAPLEMPRGPLGRLERRAVAQQEPLASDRILVEFAEQTFEMVLTRDENGTADVSMPDGVEDHVFELPKSAVSLTILLSAPRDQRPIAIGFLGHVGKPEDQEMLTRAVSFALNYLSGMPAFRVVTGIETVKVPLPLSRYATQRPARKPEDEATATFPVCLWQGADVAVAQGFVHAKVDLDAADPVTGRLLFHVTPDETLEPHWEPYRARVAGAVSDLVGRQLSADEIQDLTYSIVLNELGDGDLGRLKAAIGSIVGLDVNETQYMPRA